jgi:hypothetical protein
LLPPITSRKQRKEPYKQAILKTGHVALKIRADVSWIKGQGHDLVTVATRQLARYHDITLETIGQQ